MYNLNIRSYDIFKLYFKEYKNDMELNIGEVIYRLRKEKGITQESLAKAVGVSVAAVSKWESKNSYPDITILPSIARFFNTNIDKLLSYEINISDNEVLELVKGFAELFEKDTTVNAIKACEDCIKQYPNNLFLKFRIGSLYMMSISSANIKDEADIILNKAIDLLEISSNSENKEISDASKYVLSSLYTMKKEEQKAEEILLTLPKVTIDRDDMLAGLYINQKKYKEAKMILRNLTYRRLTNMLMSIQSFATIYTNENNIEKAIEIYKIKEQIVKIFELDDLYAVSSSLMFSTLYAKNNNKEKTIDYLEKIVKSLDIDYDFKNHILFDGIELQNNLHTKEYFKANMKRLIMEDDNYTFLKSEERYKVLIEELDNLLK